MQDSPSRLASLQRSVERQRYLLFLLALVAILPWLVAFRTQDEEPLEELRVRLFEVVAEDGRVLFSVAPDAGGNGHVALFNHEEVRIVDLGATTTGHGAADFFTSEGTPVVYLGASNEGDGGVRTVTADGPPAFYMGHDMRGNGRVPADVRPGGRVY